jgi:hypothetical protein
MDVYFQYQERYPRGGAITLSFDTLVNEQILHQSP